METATETELFARVGRQSVRIEQLQAAYGNALNVFADVLEGKIDPRRILIDRTNGMIQTGPDGFSAAPPATINGFPVCAIYKPFPFPAEAEAAEPKPKPPAIQDPPGGEAGGA